MFAMTILAFLIALPVAWLTFDSWRMARHQKPIATSPSIHTTGPATTEGSNSPANTGGGNTFIYDSPPEQHKK
jgi:hypothetical protein